MRAARKNEVISSRLLASGVETGVTGFTSQIDAIKTFGRIKGPMQRLAETVTDTKDWGLGARNEVGAAAKSRSC